MLTLKGEKNSKLLGKVQFWEVTLHSRAIVSYSDDICSINIEFKEQDVTEEIGVKLNKESENNYKISGGIDSYFIEIPVSETLTALQKIYLYCDSLEKERERR